MDYTERALAPALRPSETIAGEWYLRGFADAYGAHWAAAPCGPAGEQYKKGYALGVAAVRSEFFAAAWGAFHGGAEPSMAIASPLGMEASAPPP